MNIHKLLDELAQTLVPDQAAKSIVSSTVSEIQRQLDRREIRATATVGGSFAKNTHLPDSHDVDIFVRFDKKYSDDQLADLLETCLKQYKPMRVHGSRDYFQFSQEGLDFEIVPVVHVANYTEARNVTDMSALHVTYFTKHGKNLVNEVRLLKQFCIAAKVYGAESYLRGFSGHVVDILILQYKSFYETLKAAASWKSPVVIDVAKHHTDALQAITKEKHSPLIVVDPLQPQRNAAAALSQEQFDRFIAHAKAFITNPSKEFFQVKQFSKQELIKGLKQAAQASIVITATHTPEERKDVAGAKVRKVFERVEKELAKNEFTLVNQGWNFIHNQESTYWFVLEEHSLPRIKLHMGPPLSNKQNAQKFREQHSEVYEQNNRLVAKVNRLYTKPEEVVKAIADKLHDQFGVALTVETIA